MEPVEGATLAERLADRGDTGASVASGFSRTGLPIEEALVIARQIAEALCTRGRRIVELAHAERPRDLYAGVILGVR